MKRPRGEREVPLHRQRVCSLAGSLYLARSGSRTHGARYI